MGCIVLLTLVAGGRNKEECYDQYGALSVRQDGKRSQRGHPGQAERGVRGPEAGSMVTSPTMTRAPTQVSVAGRSSELLQVSAEQVVRGLLDGLQQAQLSTGMVVPRVR